MRTFKEPNWTDNNKCPICHTTEIAPVMLIPIVGTQDGNNVQAIQVHEKCIEEGMWYYPEYNTIIVADKPL